MFVIFISNNLPLYNLGKFIWSCSCIYLGPMCYTHTASVYDFDLRF